MIARRIAVDQIVREAGMAREPSRRIRPSAHSRRAVAEDELRRTARLGGPFSSRHDLVSPAQQGIEHGRGGRAPGVCGIASSHRARHS